MSGNRKQQKKNYRPFHSIEGEVISIGFFGSRKEPKIAFSRIVRDREGNPVRYERTFSHEDLFLLRDAIDHASKFFSPTTEVKPLVEKTPKNNPYLNPQPEYETVIGERLDGSRYQFQTENPKFKMKR